MMKFQVGDRVKVMSDRLEGQLGGYAVPMKGWVGKIYTIKKGISFEDLYGGVRPKDSRGYGGYRFLENTKYIWDERLLKRVRKAKPQEEVVKAPKAAKAAPAMPAVVAASPEPVKAAIRRYDTDVHKKLIQDLKYSKEKDGICGFGVGYANEEAFIYKNAPCHADIGYMRGESPRVALLLDFAKHSHMLHDPKYAKTYQDYCKYIMTESPRANCFHYEGMEKAWEDGVFMNVSRPIEELAGAAVALREGSEYRDKLPMFKRVLDCGFSGNVAYLLSYCVAENMVWQGFSDGHRSLKGTSSFAGIIKFFREGYYLTKDLKPYDKSREPFRGIAKWCSPISDKKTLDIEMAALLGVAGARTWDYISKVSDEKLMETAQTLEKLLS